MDDAVQISVKGKKYLLNGTYSGEYLKRVEKYINLRIEDVERAGGPLDSSSLMVLVALNLADDCLKKEDEISSLLKNVEDKTMRLINVIDSHI